MYVSLIRPLRANEIHTESENAKESEGQNVYELQAKKIYYQIKFLTGDIALSFRFGSRFLGVFELRVDSLFWEEARERGKDHLLHIPFDSSFFSAISDWALDVYQIKYISFCCLPALGLYFIISIRRSSWFICYVSAAMCVYWFTVQIRKFSGSHQRQRSFVAAFHSANNTVSSFFKQVFFFISHWISIVTFRKFFFLNFSANLQVFSSFLYFKSFRILICTFRMLGVLLENAKKISH